jgi:outer membrane protein, heavy metal efflux system
MKLPSLACLAALALSVAAHAQPAPPDAVDLAAVLALAREEGPRLRLERQKVAAARADLLAAEARPNPVVSAGRARQPGELTNFGSRNAQDVSIELPLQLGGQRAARIAAADRGIDAAEAHVAASRHERVAEAGASHVALLLAQQRASALSAHVDEVARLRAVVEARRDGGLASDYDLLRLGVEQVGVGTRAAEARADVVEQQARLASLLGLAGWRPVARDALRPLPDAGEDDMHVDHPDLVAAHRDELASQAAVDVARRERFPNVALQAGQFWTTAPYGKTYSVGVSVEVPIFDSRRGAVDRAAAEASAAALRRHLVEVQLEADRSRLEAQVAERRDALDRFERDAGSRLGSLRQMAQDAYRLGRSTLAELLDATRARHDLELDRLALTASLMEAQIRLQAARGRLAR